MADGNEIIPQPKKTLTVGGKVGGIIPQSFEDVQRMAKMAVAADLAPRDRDDSDEKAIAKATASIMHGLEIGVPPMQALQNIAVINKRTIVWGELLVAV